MVEDNVIKKEEQKRWLTKKIRMATAERYNRQHHFSHIYLTYYSIFIVGLNIFRDGQKGGFTNYDNITLILSVVVLCAAIFVYALDFSGKAREFRDCYLKIDELENSTKDPVKLEGAYDDILKMYPNHSSRDYEDYLYSEIITKGRELHDSEGHLRAIPWRFRMKILGRKTIILCLYLLAFLMPIILLYINKAQNVGT